MKKRIVFIALFIQIILASFVFAETTQITNGLNYLTSTQSADGSWTAGEESAIATAEAIETLKLLKQTGTANYANALSWLQNQSLESTNHIAERIYSLAAGGTDSTALISYLNELALAWGGYIIMGSYHNGVRSWNISFLRQQGHKTMGQISSWLMSVNFFAD